MVDQIAAGEVVDRPASVVKELVENSVDAGSSLIEVVLQDGGRTLISVADDGCGMMEQDALMAIERHATSKIATMLDLVGIRSFGFRGEALPSIAAVSKFEMLTRRADDLDGTRVRVHGGKLVDVRPAGAAAGTHIRARQLFYNLPARKAFLRQPSTELGHCVQVVTRMALGRPGVGFTLQHGGRRMINAPVADSLAQRAIDVLGPDARRLVWIEAEAGDLRLTGLVSPPHVHRSTGNGAIYSFVNGRWVRDLVLRRAIQQAYRDLTPRGRYPIVVLHLELAGNGVDVNVHPTKAEVQFRDPASVGSFVAQSVRHRVLAESGQPAPRPVHLREAMVPPLPFREAPSLELAPTPVPPIRPPRQPEPPVAAEPEPSAQTAEQPEPPVSHDHPDGDVVVPVVAEPGPVHEVGEPEIVRGGRRAVRRGPAGAPALVARCRAARPTAGLRGHRWNLTAAGGSRGVELARDRRARCRVLR